MQAALPIRSRDGRAGLVLAALMLLACPPGVSGRQSPPNPDTAAVTATRQTVQVADRAESTVASSASAVSVISVQPLAGVADMHLSEALRFVPGVAMVDFDAVGHDPGLIIRGFRANADGEYVTVLLDGKPLNDLVTGEIVWDLIPTVALSEIEVLRGPAASLYGDGAVAGVINLVSIDPDEPGYFDFRAGAPQTVQGAARGAGELLGFASDIYGTGRWVQGFRDNEARVVFNAGGSLALVESEDRSLELSAYGMWRDVQRPGPLPADEIEDDPQSIELFYSFDGTQEWVSRVDLDGELERRPGSRLSASVLAEARRRDEIRTVQPNLDEGDTKERVADTRRLHLSAKLEQDDLGLPWSDRLVVGVDASLGELDTEVKDIVSGGAVTYVFSDPTRPVVASGRGSRSTVAGYARYEARPFDALRVRIGGRYDALRDSFEPGAPSPDVETTARHSAFTPTVGANLRWIASDRQTGHLYVSASRAFRAPNPRQLFDQRSVPIFGAVNAPIANPLLDPERSTSLEVGAYHELTVVPGTWTADASLAVYRMDMEDEIAFDPSVFRYDNVAESRHTGAEVGVTLHGPSGSRFFASYARQDVVAQAGDNEGNELPVVPKNLLSVGASARPVGTLAVGAFMTRHGDAWLDAANTARVDGYTRVDAWGSVDVLGLEVLLSVIDLFDGRYTPVGFIEPGGTGTPMLFPSAGRLVEVGFRAAM